MSLKVCEMAGVREYAEGLPVSLDIFEGRLVVRAENEGGCNCVLIDLLDLSAWLRTGEASSILGESSIQVTLYGTDTSRG